MLEYANRQSLPMKIPEVTYLVKERREGVLGDIPQVNPPCKKSNVESHNPLNNQQ